MGYALKLARMPHVHRKRRGAYPTRLGNVRTIMDTYHAAIANCLIGGETWSNIDNKSCINIITLQLDDFVVRLEQNPIYNAKSDKIEYRNKTFHTTDVFIENLDNSRLNDANILVRNLCELLSFATCSEVAMLGYDYQGPYAPT
jgi:hypothetical protein